MKICPICKKVYPDSEQMCDKGCSQLMYLAEKDITTKNKYDIEKRKSQEKKIKQTTEYYRKKKEDEQKRLSSPPPEVKCPKCGSTQIQAVRKNWSLLTGFLTNDVDRVCLNCKHKF